MHQLFTYIMPYPVKSRLSRLDHSLQCWLGVAFASAVVFWGFSSISLDIVRGGRSPSTSRLDPSDCSPATVQQFPLRPSTHSPTDFASSPAPRTVLQAETNSPHESANPTRNFFTLRLLKAPPATQAVGSVKMNSHCGWRFQGFVWQDSAQGHGHGGPTHCYCIRGSDTAG